MEEENYGHDLESGDTLEAVQPPGTYQLDEDEDIRENRNATVRPVQTLPTLPTHRFTYSVWHDLKCAHLHGPQLKAPRIRDGPPIKEKLFTNIRDQNDKRIHHSKKGRERMNYQKEMEDWENAKQFCNLSYQDLSHDYQMKTFLKVLRRLIRVEDLNLMDNSLQDLQSVSLPVCRRLNLTTNYLKSLKKLPRVPRIQHLILSDNHIETLSGLESFKKSPLEALHLDNNPVAFQLNYRQNVFKVLPNLQTLDGVPRLPEDGEFLEDDFGKSDEDENPNKCSIS